MSFRSDLHTYPSVLQNIRENSMQGLRRDMNVLFAVVVSNEVQLLRYCT